MQGLAIDIEHPAPRVRAGGSCAPGGLTALGLLSPAAGPMRLLLLSLGPGGGRALACGLDAAWPPAGVLVPAMLTLLVPQGPLVGELRPGPATACCGRLWPCTLRWRTPLCQVVAPEAVLARSFLAVLDGRHGTARALRVALAVLELSAGRDLADACQACRPGVGLRQLERDFKRCLGLAPSGCARLVQVQRAAAALLGGASLAQAATGCGFADQPHMTRAFRRIAGVTPGALRARVAAGQPGVAGAQPGGSGRGRPCSSTAT